MTAEKELCSKCHEAPRAAEDSTNPWCHSCRAKYAREYRKTTEGRLESRGFLAGVAAARDLFARKFAALGNASFSGVQAAQWVKTEPGPPLPD